MARVKTYGFVAGSFLLLLAVSLPIFLQAGDEPFVHFRPNEALVQVGVASAVTVLWLFFGIGLSWLAFKRHVSRWTLLTLFLVALAILIMGECPLGYVSDINHFAFGGR